MANPAAFERELRAVFSRLQNDTEMARHGHYSFYNVKMISPLFRCSNEPVAAPRFRFPGSTMRFSDAKPSGALITRAVSRLTTWYTVVCG